MISAALWPAPTTATLLRPSGAWALNLLRNSELCQTRSSATTPSGRRGTRPVEMTTLRAVDTLVVPSLPSTSISRRSGVGAPFSVAGRIEVTSAP